MAESRNGGYEQVKGTLRNRRSKISARSSDHIVTTAVCSRPTRQPQRYAYSGRIANTQGRTKVSMTFLASWTHSCPALSRQRRKIQLARISVGMAETKRTPRM